MESRLGRIEHPVALFSNGLGDALLTLPAVRALTMLFPGRLTLLCPRQAFQLCYQFLPLKQWVELIWAKDSEADAWDGRHGRVHPFDFDVIAAAASVDCCDLFLSLVPWHARSIDELVLRLIPHTTIGLSPTYDWVA